MQTVSFMHVVRWRRPRKASCPGRRGQGLLSAQLSASRCDQRTEGWEGGSAEVQAATGGYFTLPPACRPTEAFGPSWWKLPDRVWVVGRLGERGQCRRRSFVEAQVAGSAVFPAHQLCPRQHRSQPRPALCESWSPSCVKKPCSTSDTGRFRVSVAVLYPARLQSLASR